jgi:hypothetical protein
MHNNSSSSSSSLTALETDLIGIRVVSYVAFVLFGLASTLAGVILIQRIATNKSGALAHPLSRQALAAALLACGWLFAGLNPLLVNTPDGVWSLMRVLLNAGAWEWTLAQLADYYYVFEPMRSETAMPIRRAALLLLVLAACGNSPAKFIALTAALPLAAVVALCASLWSAAPDRAIWPLTHVRGAHDFNSLFPACALQVRFGHVVFVILALTGLWALVCEVLSAEYSGLLSLTISFALMLPEHAVLVLLWFGTALAPRSITQEDGERRFPVEAAHMINDTPLLLDNTIDANEHEDAANGPLVVKH